MKISELYAPNGPFVGSEMFIVGTGPSMKVFPIDYLNNRICVLLNDASKLFNLGPIAFSNHRQWIEPISNLITYPIVKARFKNDKYANRPDNHIPWDHPTYYCFSYREKPWDAVSHHDEQQLWIESDFYWNVRNGSVAIFAVQFAALAGAKSVTLVGCDCMALDGRHYADDKLSKRKQKNHDYDAYVYGLCVLQRELMARFKIPLMTLTPFCGLHKVEQQFENLLHGHH